MSHQATSAADADTHAEGATDEIPAAATSIRPRRRPRVRSPTHPRRCAPPSSRPRASPACCTRRPSPSRPRAQRAARARRGGGRQPDRREDPRRRGRLRLRSARTPRCSGYDFSGIVVRSPYESHPLPPGNRRCSAWLPFPRSGGSYAEYARRAVAVGRPQARVALARRGGGRAAGRAHRVGSRRRDRPRARGTADPDPRRQRRRGPLRRAVRRVLRRARDRDRLGPQRLVAARARRVGRHRLHHDPIRGRDRRCRRRHRPRRQRARDRRASAR